jgi:membrane associated rhomboid family serine protease
MTFDPTQIPPTGRAPAAKSRRPAALPWREAGVLTVAFVALLYVVEAVNAADHGQLSVQDGVHPRAVSGLWGILWAPALHANWGHLVGNTIPVLVLGFLTLLSGIGRGLLVTAIVWVVAGLGQWLTGESGSSHIGASVLIFGWLAFLLVRGLFNRSIGEILLGAVLFVVYGSVLWGVLPNQPGISWQGHLFGAVGGVLAAALLAPSRRRATPAPPAAGPLPR